MPHRRSSRACHAVEHRYCTCSARLTHVLCIVRRPAFTHVKARQQWPLGQPQQCIQIGTNCCYGVGCPLSGYTYVEVFVSQPRQSCKARIEKTRRACIPPSPVPSRRRPSLVRHSQATTALAKGSREVRGSGVTTKHPCHGSHVSPTWLEQIPRRPFTQCNIQLACVRAYLLYLGPTSYAA
jgi:hypothetical protein